MKARLGLEGQPVDIHLGVLGLILLVLLHDDLCRPEPADLDKIRLLGIAPEPNLLAEAVRNLGHPGPEALAELLAARGASESVINAAKGYVCTACAKYKRPAQAAPAAMPKAKDFNALVQADVFWLRRGSTKFPILSLVDSATRHTAAILLKNEQSEHYIRAVEKAWIAVFGPPVVLMTDEGRPWLGRAMDEWTTAHNIEHEVAPGEAHERLALWNGVTP